MKRNSFIIHGQNLIAEIFLSPSHTVRIYAYIFLRYYIFLNQEVLIFSKFWMFDMPGRYLLTFGRREIKEMEVFDQEISDQWRLTQKVTNRQPVSGESLKTYNLCNYWLAERRAATYLNKINLCIISLSDYIWVIFCIGGGLRDIFWKNVRTFGEISMVNDVFLILLWTLANPYFVLNSWCNE